MFKKEVGPRNIISPEEFKEKMQEYANNRDIECAHMDADVLMMNVLSSFGYGEGVEIFNKMEKWYA